MDLENDSRLYDFFSPINDTRPVFGTIVMSNKYYVLYFAVRTPNNDDVQGDEKKSN